MLLYVVHVWRRLYLFDRDERKWVNLKKGLIYAAAAHVRFWTLNVRDADLIAYTHSQKLTRVKLNPVGEKTTELKGLKKEPLKLGNLDLGETTKNVSVFSARVTQFARWDALSRLGSLHPEEMIWYTYISIMAKVTFCKKWLKGREKSNSQKRWILVFWEIEKERERKNVGEWRR